MGRNSRPKPGKRRRGGSGLKTVGKIIGVLLVLFMLSRWGWTALEKNRVATEQLQALRAEKLRLELVQSNLQEEIENLETPAYIEELAREQLGLVRKGEILVAPREDG
ncbi:MAG: septum formation initiator family protein [Gracilibacteraceae bacterium]|jgi:cell division protein DivIC|nr:septum formation initiator family protein [Gracilibacteraceae bacterium]